MGKIKKRAFKTSYVVCLILLNCGLNACRFFQSSSIEEINSTSDFNSSTTSSYDSSNSISSVTLGENISFHFLELGNNSTGDSIYIKAGNTDILIDAGSEYSSSATISSYINQYVTDNKLEYVIATHGDFDHIAAFSSYSTSVGIFERYETGTIIDGKSNKNTNAYNSYKSSRDAEVTKGAVHYTAIDCWNNMNGAKRSYELAEGITMNILYNYYYDHSSSDENNYSVCLLFNAGEENFLLTADLEESGESYLVDNNQLPEVALFKANHHGSNTSNTNKLLSVIKPKNVVFTCIAGSPEYTETTDNTFPTQQSITNIAKYTSNLYVTSQDLNTNQIASSMNGNIIASYSINGIVEIHGTNNNILLKDSYWFNKIVDRNIGTKANPIYVSGPNRIWPTN